MESLDRIKTYADLSIRRGCGFAFLGIATFMVGMSSDALLAFRSGAIMVTLVLATLLLKGMHAPRRSYKRTETWILMDKSHGLPEPRAQQVFGSVLRDRYFWHAEIVAFGALGLWAIAFGLRAFGPGTA
ncbi:MAG: hypothetical protein ACM3N5_03195 [Candidatus Eiseniibacteriota bacterium]